VIALLLLASVAGAQEGVTRYVRYAHEGTKAYGVLEGETIHQLDGAPFDAPRRTGVAVPLTEVRLLAPSEPSKVVAVGLNYQSHLGEREPAAYPGLFAKYPTSIVGLNESIVMPPDASNLHYEGEMVIVIGRRAQRVPTAEALDYVFGVTAGNDVSERDWQRADLQWLRAKASDTFGPVGPVIARGLDYDDLLLTTRVNGEVRQQGCRWATWSRWSWRGPACCAIPWLVRPLSTDRRFATLLNPST
jgi:2-keto-4-pentenoate hydratase/2-oxohepta-3-ene-1,7-dioic acid hydratase in catechol pathway